MDALKGKKTAAEVRQFAINMAIIMEEELPLHMMMNEARCFKHLFHHPPKRWISHLLEINSVVSDCMKYY
jgi:hypothetical protein